MAMNTKKPQLQAKVQRLYPVRGRACSLDTQTADRQSGRTEVGGEHLSCENR